MTPIPEPTPAPAPRRRGRTVALVLSLMLNLLLIGVLVGGAVRVARLQPMMMATQPDMRALWRALPDDLRDDLRAGAPALGAHPDRATRHARAAALNLALVEALEADPFDAAAFATLLAGERDQTERRLDAANAALAGALAALSPDERRAVAQRFEDSLRLRRD